MDVESLPSRMGSTYWIKQQGGGISKNASGDQDLYLIGRKTCQASRIDEGRIPVL